MGYNLKMLLLALLVVAGGPASAVNYTTISGAPDPGPAPSEILFANFDGPLAPGNTIIGDYGLGVETTAGPYQPPAGDPSVFLYTSPEFPTSSATLLTIDLSNISFYWGSIETDNAVDVLAFDFETFTYVRILTITGAELLRATGAEDVTPASQRLYISAADGEFISGLRFYTTDSPFEIDDVAGSYHTIADPSVVPEPASWTLMLGGFCVVGLSSRATRRRAMPSETRPFC